MNSASAAKQANRIRSKFSEYDDMKSRKTAEKSAVNLRVSRVLVLVDESNIVSTAWASKRSMDWVKLREFLCDEKKGRELIEMVVYAGLPPAMPAWQTEREKKSKFVHWLRTNGFLVVTKDGAPTEEGHYKSNVDVMMAIDAIELTGVIKPDVVVLVTGDADFAYLALQLRRRGIRVEVASVSANLGSGLKSAANEVIDLSALLETFEPMSGREK